MNTTTDTPSRCAAAALVYDPNDTNGTRWEDRAAVVLTRCAGMVAEHIADHNPDHAAEMTAAIAEIIDEIAELKRMARAVDSARDYLAEMVKAFDQRAHDERRRGDEKLRVAANATDRRTPDTQRARHLANAAEHEREMVGAIGRRTAYYDALRVLNIP